VVCIKLAFGFVEEFLGFMRVLGPLQKEPTLI